MQRPWRESKDSSARSRSVASTSIVDIIVLTTDPALLATLREAAGPAHQLLHAESPENAVDLLIGGRCGIFIVDVTVVRGRAVVLFDKLQAQFPEVVLLATGRREEQTAVAALVGSGRIYRFLHTPISPARAELFLSAAARRYSELHPHDVRSKLTFNAFDKPAARTTLLAVAVAAIVLPLGLWSWTQLKRSEAPPVLPVAESFDSLSTADELLRRADAALAAEHYVLPAENNAFALYRSVLALDPSNSAAQRGLEDMGDTLAERTTQALSARDVARARDTLSWLGQVSPHHPDLADLQKSVVALSPGPRAPSAKAVTATNRTQINATLTPQRVATPNVDAARGFMASNQLIEPADENALDALRSARSAEEDEGAIQIAATDLGTRVLTRALVAIESSDAASAKIALNAASTIDREFATALPDLDRIEARIAELDNRTRQASSEQALERIIRLRRDGHLIEPMGDNAVEALKSAREADPSSAALNAEQQRLSHALLESTRTALAAGDVDRADILASRAEEVLPGLPQTRALREQVGTARAQRETNTVLQAASLPRRREVSAVYPRDALLNGIEGWVDLEFTISAEGIPEGIRIKSSQPPRVFDISAVQALRQWRFEPTLSVGAVSGRRATLRMEFKLKG